MLSKTAIRKNYNIVYNSKRFYEVQRLHVYDEGSKNSISGIRATVFGGSSPLGLYIGSMLTQMGSVWVYPHRSLAAINEIAFRELRANADLGYKTAIKLSDFTDPDELDVSIKHSNTVIWVVGSKKFFNTHQEFDDANIHVPVAIAKACKNNPQIKRFIFVSAAGADPNSASRMLRTKWIGEQMVRDIYPDVTVLRPTTMFNTFSPNLSPQGKWIYMLKAFNRTFFRIEGANGTVQPVNATDVGLAAINCLRMDESIGQAYDLAGPHKYSWDEIYEQFYNTSRLKPYIIPIPMEIAMEWYHSPRLSSFHRYMGKYWMYPEFLINETLDIVADPNEKSFEDLYIKPVSFGQCVKEYVNEIVWLNNQVAETEQSFYHG